MNEPSPSPRSTHRASGGMKVVLIGLGVNVVLSAVKMIAGIVGGSYALVADAVESIADVFSSLIVVGSVRYAERPPDDSHPYGHGKAESLAGLVVSVMLFIAGLGIAVQSTRAMAAEHHAPEAFTLWILAAVIIVKETLFQAARVIAKRSGSSAVLADAWHHRADAITSIAAFIGIALSRFGGPMFIAADEVVAMLASLFIMFNAGKIMREPLHELLDRAPEELVDRVRGVAAGVAGVRKVEKVMARKIGRVYWVDMHLHVDPDLSVREGHAISGRVKAAVRREIPSVENVLVHVEPAE